MIVKQKVTQCYTHSSKLTWYGRVSLSITTGRSSPVDTCPLCACRFNPRLLSPPCHLPCIYCVIHSQFILLTAVLETYRDERVAFYCINTDFAVCDVSPSEYGRGACSMFRKTQFVISGLRYMLALLLHIYILLRFHSIFCKNRHETCVACSHRRIVLKHYLYKDSQYFVKRILLTRRYVDTASI